MLTKIHELAYEFNGDTIDLEQDAGYGKVDRIMLHRLHLRHLAEVAGLIPESAHADPDRTIARLARQMRLLYERINELDDWLNQAAQRGHEDLESECTYSLATWEMAREFVDDLDDLLTCAHMAAGEPPPKTGPLNPPTSGAVAPGNPPKSGATSKGGTSGRTAQGQLALSGVDGEQHATAMPTAAGGRT